MKLSLVLMTITAVLAGCAVANYQILKLGPIDPNRKSITVPGVGPALFEIKAALLADGWKVKVGNATLRERGTNTTNVDSTTAVTFDTAYRMYMDSTTSTNQNLGVTTFNISVVNNETNEEVLNMVGNRKEYVRYSPDEIAANLVSSLKGLQK